jgi:hypothetical protein
MTPEQKSALREAAKSATPGPWEWHPRHGTIMGYFQGPRGSICDFGDATQYYPTEGAPPSDKDAHFIALANPTAVIELLDEVERLATYASDTDRLYSGQSVKLGDMQAKVIDQRERIKQLEAALKPFSEYGAILKGQKVRDDSVLIELWDQKVTVGHLRAAHEALEAET